MLAGTLLLSLSIALPAQAQNWTGAVSDDWFTAGNWDDNQVPNGIQVAINTDDPNPTVIDGGDAVVQSFSIATGPGLEGSLSIVNGGSLSSGSGSIGSLGGQGSLTVSGTGSNWTASSVVQFGGSGGTGNLSVLDGGTVVVAIGVDAAVGIGGSGGNGNAIVSGIGSSLTTPGGLRVGWTESTGTLAIADGGTVNAGTGMLGQLADAQGVITVDGNGSGLRVANELVIGDQGIGTLEVTGGGAADAGAIILGRDAGSQGTLTVSGTGSLLTPRGSTGDFVVGWGGTGTLTVDAGGTVDGASDAYLGLESGSQGNASVTGTGSQWLVDGGLFVGGTGAGLLSIGDGGRVEAVGAFIGLNPGGTGTVTVAGAGSVLAVDGFTVASGGDGSLTVEDGGLVDSANSTTIGGSGAGDVTVTGVGSVLNLGSGLSFVGLYSNGSLDVLDGGVVNGVDMWIGNTANGQGVVTISGDGSQWNSTGELILGAAGTGTLAIAGGGTASSFDAILGRDAGGVGAVTVDGADSAWNTGGNLLIGQAGTGTLDITAGGAVVTGNQGVIGYSAGSAGTATVTGSDSVWTLHDALQVGREGTGELVIADGGVVSLDPSGPGAAYLNIGSGQGSTGTMTVSGSGSAWNGRDGIFVAEAGTGTLTIENGGVVSDGLGILGSSVGGVGTAIVRGIGSQWNSSDFLLVGRFGSGELTVEAGGSVTSASGTLGVEAGSQGAVTVTGAGSGWNVGALVVGNAGIGTLSILDGATVASASGELGESDGSEGHVVVSGAGSTWTNAGDLRIGRGGSGTLDIADGGVVSGTGTVLLAELADSTGTLNLGAAAGGTATTAGTLDAAALQFGAGSGTINFNHTGTDYVFGAAIGGSGTINQLAGTTILTGGGDAGGALNVRGGTLRVEGTLGDIATTVFDGATLGGAGAIGGDVTVADGGILAPGSSAGTLTLGSLSLSAGSILDYELGQAGVIGGGVNDLIEINGNLTLDGTLDITDIGGFGAGVYRLMNYGGALTDNGLDLGALPGGSDAQDLFVQTAIDGQVNLVNSAGLALSFWDGSVATEHNNDAIDDGDGMWNADNDNWTASDGAVNGRWDAGTFAVFGGAGGSVDVVGEQAVAGVQFMSGYTLAAGTDGALRIDGAESVIRVDPDVTATIAAPIAGAGGLVKTDTGTLVLSGANTYAGGTAIDMGTLVVSADANLGDVAGALSFDGGTLRNSAAFATARTVTLEAGGGTFETAVDLTAAGTIDGDGALAKTGDGVLTLAGTNTYAGGSTVAAGMLSVSADANLGDAAGALTLAGGILQTTAAFDSTREVVLAGGTLQTDADLGLSGTMSGGAALIKDGAGTLTLTGNNTYGGDTRVLEGMLIGDVDAIRGNLDNAGTVVFDQATDATFAGTIGGSGDMVKRGAGALTLTGNSALDWSIDVGALTARAAQFTGDAAIADGATLRFTEAGGTYAGTLSGAGRFEIAGGESVFALSGNSSAFAGNTFLEAGTLRIDGALGGLTLIAAGATLGGTGTLGSVDNAGTLAPGNSIGTLTLSGDYTHRDGAVLQAEIEPGGDSDLLDIAGTATIEGGEVQVIKLPGQYEGGTRYTLIDAAGSVSGTFDTLDQDLPFLDLLLAYDPNHVYLDVQRNDVDFDIVCGDGTFNQCQVAGALDRIADAPEVSSDLQATLAEVTTLDLPGAQAAFDTLSGEAHGSLAGILLEGHALYGQAVSRRIADRREAVGAERLRGGAWVRAYGASSDLDGDGNAHAADFEQRGLAVGFDAWGGERWLVGASFNALQIDADFRPGDHGEADAKNASLYASVQGEHAYLDAVTSFAWWDNEITRAIVVGDIAREARSEYGGHRFATHLEAGWTFAPGQTQQLTPLVSVEYAKLDQEGFREEGAQDLDLIGRSQDVERTTVSAGLRWTMAFERGDWTFEPMLQARWLHAFGDEHAEQDVAFAGAPDIGYRVRGVSWPQARGLFGVGLQMRHGDNLDLFVDVDYQKGGGLEAKHLGAGLRWRW